MEQIEPFYRQGVRGRPSMGTEAVLRAYVLQQRVGLGDEATEDAVYDSQSIPSFIR